MSNTFSFHVHSKGLCETTHVGHGTSIAAYTHILPGARIGENCSIADHVFIDKNTVIGNRVTIKCGVQLWSGMVIEDDVYIGPNVTFECKDTTNNDAGHAEDTKTIVRKGVSLGANSTLHPGIIIGASAVISPGAVVARSVPPYAIVSGNPAKITGYSNTLPNTHTAHRTDSRHSHKGTSVRGVTITDIPQHSDIRGSLSVGEIEKEIPFPVRRYFLVFDVPTSETRGEHAHRQCHQFLVAAKGTIHVVADDGAQREEFILDGPNTGIHLPPMIWGIQYRYSPDAILLVFASEHYDNEDYIRSYDEFLREVAGGSRES